MDRRVRYLIFQLPGWAIAALVAAFLWTMGTIPAWAAGVLFAAWLAKDLALYPLLRRAYEPAPGPGADLVGREGVARERLAPSGYVEVRGELWHAELLPGEGQVRAGGRVVVRRVDGTTLHVAAVEAPGDQRDTT
jgi:membrane-bound serine protease (ClpP class)